MRHRRVMALAASALLVFCEANAQEIYPIPDKAVRIVVPFAAGGGSDVIMRMVSQELAKRLKTSVLVDNKPGASGQIGADFVAKAPKDGHTLVAGSTSTHSANEYLFKRLPYDPVKDFAPIVRVSTNPLMLLVESGSPYYSIQELLNAARSNPNKLSYGYANAAGNVTASKMLNVAKVSVVSVPYKDAPQLMTDLMGRRVDFIFYDVAGTRALIESRKLRVLATSAPKRSPIAPDVPSISESRGFEKFSFLIWLGLFAPQGTPKIAIDKLNQETRAVTKLPDITRRMQQDFFLDVSDTSVSEFEAFLSEQRQTWKQLVEEAKIVPE